MLIEDYKIILVCGGREFNDEDRLNEVLKMYYRDDLVIIHGAAPGADTLAEEWAKHNQVDYRGYPAKWDLYGKAAGSIRNKWMVKDNPRIDLCIGFPGGVGTAHMCRYAKDKGIMVVEG